MKLGKKNESGVIDLTLAVLVVALLVVAGFAFYAQSQQQAATPAPTPEAVMAKTPVAKVNMFYNDLLKASKTDSATAKIVNGAAVAGTQKADAVLAEYLAPELKTRLDAANKSSSYNLYLCAQQVDMTFTTAEISAANGSTVVNVSYSEAGYDLHPEVTVRTSDLVITNIVCKPKN